jgi:3D (Asp-Asp-Asp) domain-containing protein
MKPYKSPLKTAAFLIFCIILAIILREIVRAEVVVPEPVQYEVITYEEYLTQYEPSESPTIDFEVEVEEQVGEVQELLTVEEPVAEGYTVTAYCSCEICCGEWATKRNGGPVIGAYGVELTPNYSVAAPLPFGTKLKIDGMTYEVQDTTASWIVDRYAGRIIDIYMGDSHEDAKAWGKVEMEVTILD